jgi:soluble lytic murein transglycosylase-like protein
VITAAQAPIVPLAMSYAGDLAPSLVLGFIEVESSFNPRAFLADRNGGSYGLMQLDYATAQDRGYAGVPDGLYDPAINIKLGVLQLGWIRAYLRQHGILNNAAMIAGYNAGVGAVVHGALDLPYVAKVQSAARKWDLELSSHQVRRV